jgi:hypothetical protein
LNFQIKTTMIGTNDDCVLCLCESESCHRASSQGEAGESCGCTKEAEDGWSGVGGSEAQSFNFF